MQRQIEQLYNPLFLYVKKRINNKEDAEDLTQEVFYKLAKSRIEEVDSLKSWVYTIAKNTITDYYRKRKTYMEDLNNKAIFEEEGQNAVEELSNCIAGHVKLLPQEYSSILTLAELENVSQKDIAKRLGMNYATVRSKIQRGRKKLRDIFSDCCTVIQGGKGSILEYRSKDDCEVDDDCGSC